MHSIHDRAEICCKRQPGVRVTHAGQLQPSEQSSESTPAQLRQSRSTNYKLRKLMCVCVDLFRSLVKQDSNDSF